MTPQLQDLSLSEKIQLAQELWDDIASSTKEMPLTPEQTMELDQRLTDHETEQSASSPWSEVKKRILN